MKFKKVLEKELNKLGEQTRHAGFTELTPLNRKIGLIKELLKWY